MICHAKLSDAAAIQKINLEILGYNYDIGATKAQLARVLQQPGQINFSSQKPSWTSDWLCSCS